MGQIKLSAVGQIVRRHDPDRYFTALLAPAARREALFVLYAFNHELARAREATREPMAALIRLQWWREVVEGGRTQAEVGRHEVAGPVRAAIEAGQLEAGVLGEMVDAREMEADDIESASDFEAYVMGSAGAVMVAAGLALGMTGAEALRPWGAAYGVAGVLRNASALRLQGRSLLPHGGGDVEALTKLARGWLRQPVALPRDALAAALPAVYARRDLARAPLKGARPFADRLAVLTAAARGRVP